MIRPGGLLGVRLVTAACAAGALALALHLPGPAPHPAWPLLLAAAVLGAELFTVSLPFGRQRWQFSLTEAGLAAALASAPGGWVVAPVAAGVLLAQALRRVAPDKVLFNGAQLAVGSGLAALAATSTAAVTGPGGLAALAGLGVFLVLNVVLVAVAVSLTTGQRLGPLVVSGAPLHVVHTAGNSSLGLLAAHLVVEEPLGLLGLVVPLALLWSAYAQSARRSAEARLFGELARGTEQVADRSTDASASVVLTTAARVLGGDVELLLRAPEGTVRYRGDEDGEVRRRRVTAAAFDAPEVVLALGSRGVRTGDAGGPWCAAALGTAAGTGGAPLAVLVVRRPAGARAFSRADVRLAQVLVGQAEAWLSLADLSARQRAAVDDVDVAGAAARALGDVGAETAPALVLLRDSGERLARLAAGQGEVALVVEELQLVERAVASLLGAVALAAEPDLVRGPRLDPAPPRPASEWTTTGVLP